jgi:hypothetical protein
MTFFSNNAFRSTSFLLSHARRHFELTLMRLATRLKRSELHEFIRLVERFGFDVAAQCAFYPDTQALGDSIAAHVEHFVQHGAAEGRFLHVSASVDEIIEFANFPKTIDSRFAKYFLRSMVASYLHRAGSFLDASEAEIKSVLLLAHQAGLTPYLAIGDSHSTAYRLSYLVSCGYLPIWICCWGGSARGLANSESQLRYGEQIAALLAKTRAHGDIPAILLFGQVDLEFVYYFNLVNSAAPGRFSAESMSEFIEDTVDKYMSFVGIVVAPKVSTYISAIFPPSLYDEVIRSGYILSEVTQGSSLSLDETSSRLRQLEFPTLKQRTDIHWRFNRRLKEKCAAINVRYLSVFDQLLHESGVVQEKYMYQPRGAEHHLHYNSFKELLLAAINRAGI